MGNLGLDTLNQNIGAAQGIVNQNFTPVWQGMVNPILGAYAGQQQSQIQSLNQQLGLSGLNYQTGTNYQNAMAGISGQRLDLQGEGLTNNQNTLNRQMNEYLPQEQALANQGFDLQNEQNVYGTGQQMRGLTSDATARGALQNEGTRQGFKDIYAGAVFQNKGLGLQRKGSDLSFKEQRDQLADQQKQLDIASKSLGIDRNELKTRTDYALNQLGLQNTLDSQDIIMAINDAASGKDNPLWGILPQLYQLTGIRPVASAPTSSGSSGGSKSGPAPVKQGSQQVSGSTMRRS